MIYRRTIAAAGLLAALGGLSAVSTAGGVSAGGIKQDVCHLSSTGDYRLINISENAFDQHVAHGDGVPGGAVPGMDGFDFDADCVPELTEIIYAVAYTDMVDDGGPYDRHVDVLIAKVIEANDDGQLSIGDRVYFDRFPTSTQPPFEFGQSGPFYVGPDAVRKVTGIRAGVEPSGELCSVETYDESTGFPNNFEWRIYTFGGEGLGEGFRTIDDGNMLDYWSKGTNRNVWGTRFLIDPPDTYGWRSGPLGAEPAGDWSGFRVLGNDRFLDVELNCLP